MSYSTSKITPTLSCCILSHLLRTRADGGTGLSCCSLGLTRPQLVSPQRVSSDRLSHQVCTPGIGRMLPSPLTDRTRDLDRGGPLKSLHRQVIIHRDNTASFPCSSQYFSPLTSHTTFTQFLTCYRCLATTRWGKRSQKSQAGVYRKVAVHQHQYTFSQTGFPSRPRE